jgi:hypothetical protein
MRHCFRLLIVALLILTGPANSACPTADKFVRPQTIAELFQNICLLAIAPTISSTEISRPQILDLFGARQVTYFYPPNIISAKLEKLDWQDSNDPSLETFISVTQGKPPLLRVSVYFAPGSNMDYWKVVEILGPDWKHPHRELSPHPIPETPTKRIFPSSRINYFFPGKNNEIKYEILFYPDASIYHLQMTSEKYNHVN